MATDTRMELRKSTRALPEILPALVSSFDATTAELQEAHVAAEEVDHLGQHTRLRR